MHDLVGAVRYLLDMYTALECLSPLYVTVIFRLIGEFSNVIFSKADNYRYVLHSIRNKDFAGVWMRNWESGRGRFGKVGRYFMNGK